jgi:N-acetyl-gamma-glutamyl-phosphate reductase
MVKVGIVGGTGYTGVELLRLLAIHPNIEVSVVTSRANEGTPVAAIYPNLRGILDLNFTAPELDSYRDCELVFFATPNATAMHQARALLEAGIKVIDLAADFRIKDIDVWQKWYGGEHACPDLVESAVYGLPELNRTAIKQANLVANPGCYPTSVILAMLPLLEHNLIRPESIIADCKSGVSGAGRSANVATLLCESTESVKAYNVGGHRHLPEIREVLKLKNTNVDLIFTPHLMPMIRGIHSTVYADVVGQGENIQGILENYYKDEPFVDVMPEGSHPETRSVKSANFCRMGMHRLPENGKIIMLSVIDNLVKGAAGQAIQNMNLMFGLDETSGLDMPGLMP